MYWYRILQTPVCSPFLWRFVYHYPFPLDRVRMKRAAKLLEGRHDFTSFAAADNHEAAEAGARPVQHGAGSNAMVRTINSSQFLWRPDTSMLIYQVSGNGFLHHMVRNIVGTLIEVGRGKLTPEDVTTILSDRDRTKAGPTAPAKGLCLMKVEY